jgi:hypothetical protein
MTTTPKRPLLSTFVIAAISLASPLLSSSAHANLVVNGGFEAAATDPWRATTPKTTLTRSPDVAKEGAAGATLLADGKGTGIMLQTLDAAAYQGLL